MRLLTVFAYAVLTLAGARPAAADRASDKENECLAECDKVTDPDLKAVCQRVAKLTDKEGGCLKGKWTNSECCSSLAKELTYQVSRVTRECGDPGSDGLDRVRRGGDGGGRRRWNCGRRGAVVS